MKTEEGIKTKQHKYLMHRLIIQEIKIRTGYPHMRVFNALYGLSEETAVCALYSSIEVEITRNKGLFISINDMI